MARYSYPDSPVMTLYGILQLAGSIGVDKYGISDNTGLGPNGDDLYRTYRATIGNIQVQNVGDNSIRGGTGLNSGGQYNGLDVTVGDFLSNKDATRIFKIIDVYSKTTTSVDILYEDIWMSVAKSRVDRVNFLGRGEPTIIFTATEDNVPLISWSGTDYFSNRRAIDRLQTYFSVYKPSKHFTFYPATGADLLASGDLVTVTGGTGDYSLVKITSATQTIVGQVSQVFGGNNVTVITNDRIITNFDDPQSLVGGQIGSVWYSDELGGYDLTSYTKKAIFFQLSNAIGTEVIGTTSNPTFDQTTYSFVINGTTVLPLSATGPTAMPLNDIISNINNYINLTHTTAYDDGGKLKLERTDGGAIMTQGTWVTYDLVGREIHSSANGTPPYVMMLGGGAGGGSGTTQILDEGISIGSYSAINFIGVDVLSEDSGTPGQVNVYIPPPDFASHFNTTDGTTNGLVAESLSRNTVRISSPTSEGTPFKTNGWAGSNHPATTDPTPTFSTNAVVTGLSLSAAGDSVVNVKVYDADGVSLLATYTTPTLYQNATHNSTGINSGISVIVASYGVDTTKRKGDISVNINMDTIFTANSLSGGRYSIKIEHVTDTATDGGVTYTYTQPDVFYDTDTTAPSINGAMTLTESATPANILTKHISGVEYYILNSQFDTTVSNIDNLNENTQGYSNASVYNFRISAPEYGMPTRNIPAWSPNYGTFTGWTNLWNLQDADYEYLGWPITTSNYRYRGANANGTSNVYDPWNNGNSVNSPDASILIDTYSDDSTRLGEDFNGETERLYRGGSGYVVWDSTATLGTNVNGAGPGTKADACIVGSELVNPSRFFLTDPSLATIQANLTTYKPNKSGANPNYSVVAYQGSSNYHRKFYTTVDKYGQAISSFTMTFDGNPVGYTDFSEALETSNLKVYVRRVAVPTGQINGTSGFNANPLALHGGLFNSGAPSLPFDDGASGVDTPGSLIRTENGGNTIPGTFGTGTSAAQGFWVEVEIIDKDIKIDSINVTLIFSNNETDSAPV